MQHEGNFNLLSEQEKDQQIDRIVTAQAMIKKYVDGHRFDILTPKP